MEIFWTRKAQDDLVRIYQFALHYSRQHANAVLDRLMEGATSPGDCPAMGVFLPRYAPREVRRMVFDEYEVHYEIQGTAIYILDLWHCREDR